MPQAVFHIIFAILIAEFIREFMVDKKKFPVYYVFIAGISGILPDLDIALYSILSFFGFTINEVHRTFTHSIFVPIIFLILAALTWKFKSRNFGKHHLKLHIIFLMIALGIVTHVFLDFLSGSLLLFYPVSLLSYGLNLARFIPSQLKDIFFPSLDAGILILWLIWLEARHRISNFI